MISRRGFILTWVMLVAVMALGQQFTTCISNNTNYQAYELNVDTWRNRQKTLLYTPQVNAPSISIHTQNATGSSAGGATVAMSLPKCHQVAYSGTAIQPIAAEDAVQIIRRGRGYSGNDDDDFGEGGATDNPGDVGDPAAGSPIGSPICLLLFAFIFIVIRINKFTKQNQSSNL